MLNACKVYITISQPGSPIKMISNNFIIQIINLVDLEKCITYLTSAYIWTTYRPIQAKLLVITDHVWRVEMIFHMLWRHDITSAAILVINKDENARSLLFMANSHDVQNYCGKVPNTIHVQSCDQAIADRISYPISNYHGCSIQFHSTALTEYLDEFNRKTFTITIAVEMLNVSLNQPQKDPAKINVHDGLVSSTKKSSRLSHVYTRDVMVWVVPPTNAISALEILAVNFDREVWILVSVIFALFSLAWYVLDKFQTNLGEIVLKSLRITLSGSTSRITNSSRLRFLIVCYIIYSVHIQTAYVSNLMRMITSPPIRQPIRNLKELLAADIPICLDSSAIYVTNSNMLRELEEVYIEINLRSCPIKSRDPRVLLEAWSARPNFSIALPLKTLHLQALGLRMRTPHYFIDNHILPPLMQTFAAGKSNSIIDSLNVIIDRLTESGMYDKVDRDRIFYEDSKKRELPQEEEVVALSLAHLNGIFIIYCFGVVLSALGFIGELIAYRFFV